MVTGMHAILLFLLCFLFFFSSRRRHTRFSRDWSSDVCSSDLTRFGVMKHLRVLEEAGLVVTHRSGREKLHYLNPRSEERRVGKECRSGRPWADERKKDQNPDEADTRFVPESSEKGRNELSGGR